MNVQISKKLRRFILSCFVTGAAALSPLVGSAANDRYEHDAQLYAAIKAIEAVKPENGFEQWKEWKSYLAEFVDRQMKEMADSNDVVDSIDEGVENEEEFVVNETDVEEFIEENQADESIADEYDSYEYYDDEYYGEEYYDDEYCDEEYYVDGYYDDEYAYDCDEYQGIDDEAIAEADRSEEEVSEDWDTDDWYAEQSVDQDSTDQLEIAQADSALAETELAETELAETAQAETAQAETAQAETAQAETGLAETGQTETALSETVISALGDRCLFDHDGNYQYSWFGPKASQPKKKNDFIMVAQSEEPKEEPLPLAESKLTNSNPASTSLFAVAQTICQRVGVSVQQFTEPFAMVTPTAQSTLSQIAELQQQAASVAKQLAAEDARVAAAEEAARKEAARVEIARNLRCELDSLAAERVDAYRHLGQSVLVVEAARQPEQAIEPELVVKQEPALVGCSAMIVTIDDPYLPYDLAAKDLPVWDFWPIVPEPVYIVDRENHVEIDEFWNVELVAEQEVVQEAEELMEAKEAISRLAAHLDTVRETTLPILQQWSASAFGTRLASIDGIAKQTVDRAIRTIGKAWPKPIEESLIEAELQVAELPTDTDAR